MRMTLVLLALVLVACQSASRSPPPVTDAEGRTPDVFCPGTDGCEDSDGTLLVGAGKRIVTPVVETFEDRDGDRRHDDDERFDDFDGDGVFDPVWVAGFAPGRPAIGVHDELWARAVVFSKGRTRVAILALDFVGYFHEEVVRIRQGAADAGLELDSVMVVSTHQHEGPDTMGGWGPDAFTTGKDPAYMTYVVGEAVDALIEAVGALAPAELKVAQAELPSWVADSRAPYVKDATLTVVQAQASGKSVATLAVFGNHPETLGGSNQLISADYPHYLREVLEAKYGGVAMYLPGNLGGLMNPLDLDGCPDGEGRAGCENGTFEKAEWLGSGVAAEAQILLDATSFSDETTLALRRHSFLLEVENGLFLAGFFAGVLDRATFDREGGRLNADQRASITLEEALDGALRIQSEVAAMTIGPLEILFVPGELYPELWLEGPNGQSLVERPLGADDSDAIIDSPLRPRLPDARYRAIVNQANDALGYLIPRAQFDRDPPHAYYDDGQYGEQNSIGPNAAGAVSAAVDRLYAH